MAVVLEAQVAVEQVDSVKAQGRHSAAEHLAQRTAEAVVAAAATTATR
jgi:hypothetical protein